ncbi:hypothetical protein Goari_018254, partial [Gossypium aridum]|nr:hypothetical protein [Gossypium aridum]
MSWGILGGLLNLIQLCNL